MPASSARPSSRDRNPPSMYVYSWAAAAVGSASAAKASQVIRFMAEPLFAGEGSCEAVRSPSLDWQNVFADDLHVLAFAQAVGALDGDALAAAFVHEDHDVVRVRCAALDRL